MIRFALPLSLALLSSAALAQVGGPATSLSGNPALSSYARSGNTLSASDGTQIVLSNRGSYLAGATVTLPMFDAARAGQLLGVLTGYGDGLGTSYAGYLGNPRVRPQLSTPAGTSVNAEQYQVTTRQIGARLQFSVKLSEVPASTFASSANATGPARAAVVLRLFSDFQCPYCEQFETQTWPTLKTALQKDFGGKVRVEFHQLPLEQLHPNARAAAEASECAAAQGQFWAYKDVLFDPKNWATWTGAANPNPNFLALASSVKLDADQFKTCLANRGGKAQVDAGLREAAAVGVNSTPSLYVNGYRVANIYDPAATLQLIRYVLGQ